MYSLSKFVIQAEDLAAQKKFAEALYQNYHNEAQSRGYEFTFSIRTYGCQLNESDSEKLSGILKTMSFVQGNTDDPDLVIFNTCS